MAIWGEQDFGALANKVLWPFFAITTVIVILRVFCRLRFKRQHRTGLGLDDYITLFCLVLSFVVTVLITIGGDHGLGRHSDTLSDQELATALKYNVVINAILIWQFSLPKFAIVAILKRILNYGKKTSFLFWSLACTSQACILAVSVLWFEQCSPVEFNWDKGIDGGHCMDISVLTNIAYFTSAYSAFLDIFFAFYPVPLIMKLNMPLKHRLAVSTALSLSSLAFVVSVLKLALLGEAFAMLPDDPTYLVPYLDILGMSEGYILMICSSLPTLGPLFRAAKTRLTSRDGSTAKSNGVSVRSLRKSFGNTRGHSIPDDVERATKTSDDPASSSLDDIQLVASPRARNFSIPATGIHKTVDFSITTETDMSGTYSPNKHQVPSIF
ncbi:hypothetical protein F4778DRAFT_166077 [Xylariomycetidae sp. FL2044]|nr:hypothetical protein F4778DRAFT_166077 [Xylariomycetidae sp. FL2044]